MSKKKATDYDLSWLFHKDSRYARINFLDKKGKTMMSSVDVVINLEYFGSDELRGFVYSR